MSVWLFVYLVVCLSGCLSVERKREIMDVLQLAGMWIQDVDSLSSGNSRLLMVFVAMVAIAMSAQALALIVMAVGAGKARKRGLEIAEELRLKVMPVIDSAQQLMHDTTPKIKVITENLMETSYIVRAKAQEFDVTLTDANERTRRQVQRIDGMVTHTLTSMGEIAATVQQSIRIPIREVAGIVNGLKAGMDVLVGRVKSFGIGRAAPVTKPGRDRSDLVL